MREGVARLVIVKTYFTGVSVVAGGWWLEGGGVLVSS